MFSWFKRTFTKTRPETTTARPQPVQSTDLDRYKQEVLKRQRVIQPASRQYASVPTRRVDDDYVAPSSSYDFSSYDSGSSYDSSSSCDSGSSSDSSCSSD